MTMSLPATLPTPANTGKVGSSAPGKGTASAPGQNTDPGATDAAGVAEMFAALVATLTAQMQPAATEPTGVTGQVVTEGAPVTVAAPTLAAVLAEAGVDATAVVAADVTDAVPAPAVTAGAEEATPQAATPVAVDGEVVTATPVPTQAEAGQAGEPKAATPATPATPTTPTTAVDETEGPAAPATPATPAQPQGATRAEAAAAALLAPTAAAASTDKPEPDRGIAVAPTTPTTAASASVDRAVATAPARPAAPAADPHIQVARIVRPLRLGNDGAYELALDLTPAELGRVRIDVELRGATISLTLRADNPATRELLQSSLDQLRSELEAAGLHTGNLDVGGRGASDRGDDDQHAGAAAINDVVADVVDAAPIEPTITAEDTASGVNVLA